MHALVCDHWKVEVRHHMSLWRAWILLKANDGTVSPNCFEIQSIFQTQSLFLWMSYSLALLCFHFSLSISLPLPSCPPSLFICFSFTETVLEQALLFACYCGTLSFLQPTLVFQHFPLIATAWTASQNTAGPNANVRSEFQFPVISETVGGLGKFAFTPPSHTLSSSHQFFFALKSKVPQSFFSPRTG